MIYILLKNYPYEGDAIQEVFNDFRDAEKAKDAATLADDSNGYETFSIEPWEPV
jgi:hypothetical protein